MNYPGEKKQTPTIKALNIPPPNTHQPHLNRSPSICFIFLMGLYILGGYTRTYFIPCFCFALRF